MPKRLIGFIRGDRHAVAGDYVLALAAILALMLVIAIDHLAA